MPNDPSPPLFTGNKKDVLKPSLVQRRLRPDLFFKKNSVRIFYSNAVVILHTFVFLPLLRVFVF